ncbi:hypothetical protein KEM09_15410 [Carboxylicivirga mesophila]|uniref:Uncharacterized protein n=2 Tax=Carboxylicivirga TaxID=1628153 RepID=A0A941IYD4_9BACT|nr:MULTISPECIES: hypothetical protein [Carboxylicivirga]MBR8536895.1 hypothetical protein [Carboxylicivirga sediminis]MBS2212807.1 hypothetical protein [Carboxylicivirga mesophila]
MKKLLKVLPFLLGVALLSSCSDDDDKETCDELTQNDKPAQCVDADITVCTGDDTYFIFNGTEYYEVSDLVNACAPGAAFEEAKMIHMQFDAVAMRLLNEARAAAICQ